MATPSRPDPPTTCVDCDEPLPATSTFRCVACVEEALERIAMTPPGRPVLPRPPR
jgi:hypothetical protein